MPGAGAFEFALREHLLKFVNEGHVKGKARFGVQAYAEAFLIIPKTLAQNAGFDGQDVMVKLQEESRQSHRAVGVDCDTGMSFLLLERSLAEVKWDLGKGRFRLVAHTVSLSQ